MSLIVYIVDEYAKLRTNELEPREALRSLREVIEPLDSPTRRELAGMLQKWELEEQTLIPTQPIETPVNESSVEEMKLRPRKSTTGKFKPSEWISCANCEKKNRVQEVFCYSCGHILEIADGVYITRYFENATGVLTNPDYFGGDSILVLEPRDGPLYFELRPQQYDHDLIIGRSTGSNAMGPDIDLAMFGHERGVSRMHLGINYQMTENSLEIYDLGSANGTHVNGQRLLPKWRRVLGDGDELRLGRCVVQATFHHPGTEL